MCVAGVAEKQLDLHRGYPRSVELTPDAALMAVILAVEDDVFIIQALEWTLEDMGHTALLASDLDEALGHLRAPHPIDILFVDIRLRALALGGYDVANQAIGLRPDLRVLYTSGSALVDDMTRQFVPGGRFIQKPYSPALLGSLLAELLPTQLLGPQLLGPQLLGPKLLEHGQEMTSPIH